MIGYYIFRNGLRTEFKECKDGILYSKDGFNTVMSVKTKLLNEEAVLTSKSKRTQDRIQRMQRWHTV